MQIKNSGGVQHYNIRNSSIEILKIISMLLICIGHVTQTLGTKFEWVDPSYVIDLKNTTNSLSHFFLSWMRGFGYQGNLIFFTCSAWFLLGNDKVNKKKVLYMLADVWIINFIFALIFKIGNWYDVPIKTFIKCLLPNTFELNWYITYYLIIFCIHPFLNKIISSLSRRQLLSFSVIMTILYFGIDFISGGHFGYNNLILFINIYFVIAYIKLYLKNYSENIKQNIIGFFIGIIGTLILMLLTNILGQHLTFFSTKLLHWCQNNNPFALLTAISLFNLFKHREFVNKPINYISKLTLLIYIIHENFLLRSYIRPNIWLKIYIRFGYNLIILKDLCFAIILFLFSIIIACLYKLLIQKPVYYICDKLYYILSKIYNKSLNKLLQLN